MQANRKLLEMVWLVSVVGRVEGVLVPGGDEGVVGPGLGCSGLVLAEPGQARTLDQYCLGLSLELSNPLNCGLVKPSVGLCRGRPEHCTSHPQDVGCHQGQ